MTGVSSPIDSVSAREAANVERSLVDASLKLPVLTLFGSALFWLMIATVLGVVSSLKLIWPDLLSGCAWMTYGRVWPAYTSTLLYGWAIPAGMGVSLWMAARLCRVAVTRQGWIVIGTKLWNAGVAVGLLMLLAGKGSGRSWMEYPPVVAAILFVAWLVVSTWTLVIFAKRRPGHVFIAMWYFLAAVVWFPWLILTGYFGVANATGVVQPIIASWFGGGMINLFLAAMGIGALYYLVPKVTGKPIVSYNLASAAFWSFALFAGWTGLTSLTGGPVPAWIPTVSISATIMMLVPVATMTANFALTMKGNFAMVHGSPTIRFAFFGAVAYAICAVLSLIFSLHSVEKIVQFSTVETGISHLMIYGFFSMVMFGAMYYIIPRLVGCEWLSSTFIRWHFWGAAYGMGMAIFSMIIGGLAAGAAWLQPDIVKEMAIQAGYPYMVGRAISLLLLIPAHLVFGLHFLLMVLRMGRPAGEPTLLAHGEEAH